jgi:hypothetical protein
MVRRQRVTWLADPDSNSVCVTTPHAAPMNQLIAALRHAQACIPSCRASNPGGGAIRGPRRAPVDDPMDLSWMTKPVPAFSRPWPLVT